MLLHYSGALNACLMAATQYAAKSYQEAMLSGFSGHLSSAVNTVLSLEINLCKKCH